MPYCKQQKARSKPVKVVPETPNSIKCCFLLLVLQVTPSQRGRVWPHCNHPVAATAETNKIHALCRLHLLSWSSNYVTAGLADYLTAMFDNCVPLTTRQLQRDQTLSPLRRVWLVRLLHITVIK